jgi:L-ascorbate metabolism protein UlaG (beta-lactamase superfamily)
MHIRWYGQSAFTLTGRTQVVSIDPFGDLRSLGRGFAYAPVPAHAADLLLVTHEHRDHNHVEAVTGDPHVVRSTAGRFETPVGEVVAVASEHDREAGTRRGPNSIVVFSLDGIRAAHFGDFGQSALRPEQRAAIGDVDLLFVPVGGGPTIGAAEAAAIVAELAPRWVVPMHYRTPFVGDFLEPADAFLDASERVVTARGPEHVLDPGGDGGTAVVHLSPPPQG